MTYSDLNILQKNRIDEYWNKSVLNDLMTSNVPPDFVEHYLCEIACLDDENFIIKSREYNLMA